MDRDVTRVVFGGGGASLPADGRVHLLELISGAEPGRRYVIGPQGAMIGRRDPVDILLDDPQVSRAHCRLSTLGADLYVTDLNSTNGAWVDGARVQGVTLLPVGGVLQVGAHALKHEWRTEREVKEADGLERELESAAAYVRALLPAPIAEGPIRADWSYQPSAKLGGDAFGYAPLPDGRFAFYLIDVSGHGAGAALHSVAAMNVLRQRALPGADLSRPAEVLGALNDMFPMQSHAGMYFTMWYGVFDPASRALNYASAGHHPAFLTPADRSEATPLRTRNPMIGAMPGRVYQPGSAILPERASIYLFSDGAYEIVATDGRQWGLDDFVALIRQPAPPERECQRLRREVTTAAGTAALDDDFSLLVLEFD